jgi:hypothetical protein
MRRGRRSSGKPIELFPFLAILACVIGVLTLLIAGLSLGELEIDTTGTEYVRLQAETEADLGAARALERQAESARVSGARVRHAQREIARREGAAEAGRALQEQLDGLKSRRAQLEQKRNALRASLAPLRDKLASLESELRGHRAELDGETVELRGPRTRPGQRKLRPRFVECRDDVVILDPDRGEAGRRVVPLGRVPRDSHVSSLLSGVKSVRGGIAILLVREGGVEAHDLLAALCDLRSVRCGALPVPGAHRIDYTALAELR